MNILIGTLATLIGSLAAECAGIMICKKSAQSKTGKKLYEYISSAVLPALIMLIFISALQILGVSVSESMPIQSALFGAAGTVFMLGVQKALHSGKHSQCIYAISKAALIIFLIEATVFNYSAYSSSRLSGRTQIAASKCENSVDISKSGDNVTVQSNSAEITFDNLFFDTEIIGLNFSGSAHVSDVSVIITDGNLSGSRICADKKYVYTNGTAYFTVHSKSLKTLVVTLSKAEGAVLQSIDINPKIPYKSNLLRVVLLLAAVSIVIIIKKYRLYAVKYNKKSFRQYLIAIIAAGFCMIIAATMFTVRAKDSFTVLDENTMLSGKSPYVQMTDAFVKGQLNLDLPVDDKLTAAGDKAYDPNYRTANNIYAEWDRAYYNGKYYSYFGTAPLFLFYLPIYLLSGQVPPDSLACAFFAMLTVAAGFLLIFTVANKAVKGANYLLTLICSICLPFSGLTLFMCGYGDFYTIPKLCGSFWLILLMWLTVCAYHRPRRYIFLLCGISVAFIAASRPNLLIAAVALAPFYISVLADKNYKLKFKAASVAAFLVPIILAAGALMAYNAARFGSPFEFGSKYQLTVNNIAYNNLTLGMLGAAIYHYFFQPAGYSTSFPYLNTNLINLNSYSRYSYMTAAFGLFNLPSYWAYAAAPITLKHSGLKRPYKALIVTVLASSLLIAWTDFAVAGLTISYVADIAPMLSVCSFIILLSLEKSTRKSAAVHKYAYVFSAVLLILSIFVTVMLFFSADPMNLRVNFPSAYSFFAELFTI